MPQVQILSSRFKPHRQTVRQRVLIPSRIGSSPVVAVIFVYRGILLEYTLQKKMGYKEPEGGNSGDKEGI